nr:AlNc14C7G914 [Albugo laibachii Nc14]|eukprot:CCA14874.1 AlNc14C7G914 [Albugo laibachii Nc14]
MSYSVALIFRTDTMPILTPDVPFDSDSLAAVLAVKLMSNIRSKSMHQRC